MSKLLNSEYGRLALETWENEGALKQYAKMFEQFSSNPQTIERVSIKFGVGKGGIVEKLMRNFDELEELNIEGFATWRKNIVSGASEGLFYESDIAVIIKNKGHTLEKLGLKIPGTEIDNIFSAGNKRIAAEIKSGNPSKFIQAGHLDQLRKYLDYATNNNIDEDWLISKSQVPLEVKEQFENIGVIVKWAGEL